MELKDILTLSAMALFLVVAFGAIWFIGTAQKKMVATLSLDLNDKQSATYIVEETTPYDKFEWVLEKKQKAPTNRFGYGKIEYVKGMYAKPAGRMVVRVDGRVAIEQSIDFSTQPETGQAYYADYVVKGRGVARGCLYSGNVVSVEMSSLDIAFDAEVYFCTSKKARVLGYRQSA